MQLVAEWKKFYKMASFWAFVAIGCMPELYAIAVQYQIFGLDQDLPTVFARLINVAAGLGVMSRLVKQKALELEAQKAVAVA